MCAFVRHLFTHHSFYQVSNLGFKPRVVILVEHYVADSRSVSNWFRL